MVKEEKRAGKQSMLKVESKGRGEGNELKLVKCSPRGPIFRPEKHESTWNRKQKTGKTFLDHQGLMISLNL